MSHSITLFKVLLPVDRQATSLSHRGALRRVVQRSLHVQGVQGRLAERRVVEDAVSRHARRVRASRSFAASLIEIGADRRANNRRGATHAGGSRCNRATPPARRPRVISPGRRRRGQFAKRQQPFGVGREPCRVPRLEHHRAGVAVAQSAKERAGDVRVEARLGGNCTSRQPRRGPSDDTWATNASSRRAVPMSRAS